MKCRACPLKAKCCPNMPTRRIVRDVNEAARDVLKEIGVVGAGLMTTPSFNGTPVMLVFLTE
jgi:hypothetical protein